MSTEAVLKVPAGRFTGVVKFRSFLLPEKEREVKWYAKGAGTLKEQGTTGAVELVAPPNGR